MLLAVAACAWGCASSHGHGGPATGTLVIGGGSEQGSALRRDHSAAATLVGDELAGVRLATADDLARALAAALTEPVLLALQGVAASVPLMLDAGGELARALPQALAELVCALPDPAPTDDSASFVLEPAADGVPTAAVLRVADRVRGVPTSSGAPTNTALAPSREALEGHPVRLELRAFEGLETGKLRLEAGGWLICALPTLEVRIDGRLLGELPGWPRDSSAELTVRNDRVRLSVDLPARALDLAVRSSTLELRWGGASATFVPVRAAAASEFGRWLVAHTPEPAEEASAPPTPPPRSAPPPVATPEP